MSNATKFLLAALVALFVTVTVNYANAEPPAPGQWFIKGSLAGAPHNTYDYYQDRYFPTETECVHAMLTDAAIQPDLRGYAEAMFKEYPGASLTITCAMAVVVPGKDA